MGYTASDRVELVFEICPQLSRFLREHSKCPTYRLYTILDEDNRFYFDFYIKRDNADPKRIIQFIRKVEQISNEGDDEYLFKHIITDNGKLWVPGNLRSLITEKYDVPDWDDMFPVYRFFMELEKILINDWDD